MSDQFYSQCGEDRWIVENLQLPSRGVFVDVGAADGVNSSNTKHFEEIGWTGLCIEPNPMMFEKLCKTRRCAMFKGAIASETGGVPIFHLGDEEGFIGGFLAEGDVIPVAAARLDDLLRQNGIAKIDLLSIDTEGTELDVWASFDWKIWTPHVVMMEHQTMDQPSGLGEIRQVFSALPYREVLETKFNLVFELDESFRKSKSAA